MGKEKFSLSNTFNSKDYNFCIYFNNNNNNNNNIIIIIRLKLVL